MDGLDEGLGCKILRCHLGCNGLEGPGEAFHYSCGPVVAWEAKILVDAESSEKGLEILGSKLGAWVTQDPLEGSKLAEKFRDGLDHCWSCWSLQHLNHGKT
jgi:hypothetical protein